MPSFYVIPLAFILGFALSRAATCTVAATGRWINQGKMDWLFGLTVVASWAAIVLFLLVEWTGRAYLPLDIPLNGQLFFGAALMGLGAMINRACFIGTVGYIGTGRFSYLLSFVGLGFALWLALVRRNKAYLALIAIGICAATIYGTHPEWAYTALLNSFLQGQGLSVGKTVELAVIALFAGAIFSSWLKDRFKPEWGGWKLALANLAGGFLMGIGASAVPGGNDVLLMWTIPGLTLYGLVAYLTMIATIAIAMLIGKRFNRRISPPF